MSKEQNKELENWDSLAGDWLKADLVKENPWKLVVTGASIETKDDKKQLVLDVEYHNRQWKFGINRTNQFMLIALGETPKSIIGKVLIGSKMKVNNPKTGKPCDSLIIEKVE